MSSLAANRRPYTRPGPVCYNAAMTKPHEPRPRARAPHAPRPRPTLTVCHTNHTRTAPTIRTGTQDRHHAHIAEARAVYDVPAVTPTGAVVRPKGYVRLMHVRNDQKERYEQRPTVTPTGELRTVWVKRDAPVTPNQHAAYALLAEARRAM